MRCGGQVVYCEDRHQGALLCLGGGGYTEPVSPRPLHLHRISSLGSNVGCTRFETACAPGAQPPIGLTWHLGSVSEPRPPVGCSPRVRPFPPRPPPEVAFLCSIASSVLRPHPTSHPRTCSAYGFCLPEPARTSPGTGETSQVPHKELHHVRKAFDCARFCPCKPIRNGRCCLLVRELATHLGIRPVSQLNTRPVVSPVNASRLSSRTEPRASLGVGVVG